MRPAFSEIETVLRHYYDGLFHCDLALLETAFHPDAHYHTTSGGQHLHYDMKTYMEMINARMPPAETGDTYGYDVQSIRFAGYDTAFAVLTCTMMGKRFTDFLSFICDGGQWRIIAKVFHYDLIQQER